MFMIVIAICVTLPRSDIEPSHKICWLIKKEPYYETLKECNNALPDLLKDLSANNKEVEFGDSMCVDRSKTIETKPNLKPITPEQQSEGYKNL